MGVGAGAELKKTKAGVLPRMRPLAAADPVDVSEAAEQEEEAAAKQKPAKAKIEIVRNSGKGS